jgi:type VI secretion system protein ImpL
MSWHTSQLTYALGFGGMMSFYGVVSLIVFLLPPSTGVGSTEKIVIIALVLLTLPFALLIMFVASRRAKKRAKREAEAAAAVAAAPAAEAEGAAAPQKLAAAPTNSGIAAGIEEVVQFLKASNLGEGGKDAIYSLPWFLVAGPPRSGKSSLVMSSNLNFQNLPSQRQSEQKFIRPTANVDWRVTSDAVFLDTAGRYQTEGLDGEEWSSLLETVRKYRPNRPIDGMVLVVNSDTLLKSDERQLEETAKVLRGRLDETIQRLKIKFPVYVVFSHADSIEGFRDSFSASKNEDKTLVWGAAVPLDKSDNAQAMFDGEYEVLHNSLMKRRLVRLSAPFPPVRQLRIFNFPLHFGSARRRFGAFVNALFRPNPFSENPLLRGFYFTAVPAAKAAGNAPQAVGTSYFGERFFRDVLLRDKDLARTFIAQRQRPPIFGWFLTLVGAAIVLFLLAMTAVSLITNRQMLQDAEARGEKVLTIVRADAGKNPLEKNEQEARRELNAADDLRGLLVQLDDYDRTRPPIYMRFGMYSGDQIYKRNLLPTYFSVIEQRFKAPTIRKVESELQKFAASQPVANPAQLTEKEEQTLGKYYDLLKAYLMLSGDYKEKADGTHIANALREYWTTESKVPPDMKLAAQQQLDFWAKQVDRDDSDVRFPRITLNGKLVDDTRRKLQAFPAVYRYYSRKVTEISKEVDDKIGPTNVEAILTRNGADTSYLSGTYSVPSAFTRPGYVLMKTAIAEADQKLSEDDWVMGELGKKELAQSTDASRLEDRYFRDYADHWRNLVKGTTVKAYKTPDDASRALQAFSLANSPMKILAREIARNTNLSAKPEVEGWWEWIKSFFSSGQDNETGGTQPEKEFRPLFTFIGTKEQAENAPVERYQNEIGKAYNDINGLSVDRMKVISQKMANDEDPIKLRARETAISNLIAGFNETSSAQALAILLQQPLGNLKELLGADAKSQLAKTWTDQILPAAKEIEKGYPFEDGQAEADLTKLTAFLKPGEGTFSKFYDERLSKYFEESGGELKLKDTAEVKFSDEFVAYLNAVMALRKGLFGSSPTPKFEYTFVLKPSKDALIEVTIDGQSVKSEGTGSINGSFPGSGDTGVLLSFASTSGVSSTGSSGSNTNSSSAPPADTGSSSSSLKFQGTWGLFRFVDAGRPQKQPGGEYLLSYSLGGKPVSATIKPNGTDLFDKTVFSKVKAPQSFVK